MILHNVMWKSRPLPKIARKALRRSQREGPFLFMKCRPASDLDVDGKLLPGLRVAETNQEHGIIAARTRGRTTAHSADARLRRRL